MQNDDRSIPFGWLEQLQEWWQKQPFVNRFYLGGLVFFGLCVIYVFATLKEPGPHIWTPILFWLGVGLLLIGIVIEAVIATKQILAKSWGKWAMGITGAFVWSLCVLVARHDINNITHVSPEYFGASTNWLAAISAPFVFAVLLNILIVLSPLPFAAWKFFKPIPKPNNLLLSGRVFGFMSIFALMSAVLYSYSAYGKTILNFQTSVLVFIDYYSDSSCTNVSESERVAFIGRDIISVANLVDDRWQFETRTCRLAEVHK